MHVQELISTAKYLKYSACSGNSQCATNILSSFESKIVVPKAPNDTIEKYLVNKQLEDGRLKLPKLNLEPCGNAATQQETTVRTARKVELDEGSDFTDYAVFPMKKN